MDDDTINELEGLLTILLQKKIEFKVNHTANTITRDRFRHQKYLK
jgi:hypothetical protein